MQGTQEELDQLISAQKKASSASTLLKNAVAAFVVIDDKPPPAPDPVPTGRWSIDYDTKPMLRDPSGKVYCELGANWHGFQGWDGTYKPEGVWAKRSIRSMADELHGLGIRTMRVPLAVLPMLEPSLAMVKNEQWDISEENAKYRGQTVQQGLVIFLQDLIDAGLVPIVDFHSVNAGDHVGAPTEAWYAQQNRLFTTDDFVQAHRVLAQLLKPFGNKVLCQELWNEMHGSALYSGCETVDAGQWHARLAFDAAAAAIAEVDPDRLIGVDFDSQSWPRDAQCQPDPDAPSGVSQGWGENGYGVAAYGSGVEPAKRLLMPHLYGDANHPPYWPGAPVMTWRQNIETLLAGTQHTHALMLGETAYAPAGGDTLDWWNTLLQLVREGTFSAGVCWWGVSPNQNQKQHAIFTDDFMGVTDHARKYLGELGAALVECRAALALLG